MGWTPLVTGSRQPLRGNLPFVFVTGEVPGAAIEWGGGAAVRKALPVIFAVKPEQIVRRGMCGSASAEEKMDSVQALWAGMCVFGKMDGSRCPHRDAAQCSSIAASELLAGRAWHSHPAPAAPARPHPGPEQPFACARSCFYLVMVLWRDVASEGAGHLGCEGGSLRFGGDSSCPACWLWGTKARPAALMQAKAAGLRMRAGA